MKEKKPKFTIYGTATYIDGRAACGVKISSNKKHCITNESGNYSIYHKDAKECIRVDIRL